MTSNPLTRAELIERLEKASGPDRELDGAITRLVLGCEVERVSVGPYYRTEDWVTTRTKPSDAAPTSTPVPRYTASLDAAMSLVPSGWCWSLSHLFQGRSAGARLFRADSDYEPKADAATPALALVAAALRARGNQS